MYRFQIKEKQSLPELNLGSRENSFKKKNLNVFVDSGKKKKKANQGNLGFEYDHDVTNDTDYCKKILEKNCYYVDYNSPSLTRSQWKQSALSEITNRRQDASILSEGSPAFPLRVAMTLAEKEPEITQMTLTKYAQKKLGKKARAKEGVLKEEVYIIKVNWLVKMAKLQSKTHKHNLNNFRLILEEIIEEISPAFGTQIFQNQKQAVHVLKKVSHYLAKLEPQKAILLSFKLFKMHLKQLNLEESQSRLEVAKKLHSFLLPYVRLMQIKEVHPSEKDHKERTNLVTYRKIMKFIQQPEITEIITEYPDPRKGENYIQKLRELLSERVSFERAIAQFSLKNSEIIEEEPLMSINEIRSRKISDDLNPVQGTEYCDSPERHLKGQCEKSFENARSIELDEICDENANKMQQYNFFQRCQMGKAEKGFSMATSCPSNKVISIPELVKYASSRDSNNNASIESSNEAQDDGSDSERELMEDPELYRTASNVQGNKVPKLLLDGKPLNLDEMKVDLPIAPLKLEQSESPNPKLRSSLHFSRQASGNKEPTLCCDDINLKIDPLRVNRKPDLVRMNSVEAFHREKKEEEDDKAELRPSLKGAAEERLSLRRRPSICQSRLSVTKMKKEMNFQKILNIAYDEVSKWETVINTQLIKIQKIRPENSPVVLLRVWTCVEGFNSQEIFDQIYDTERRAKWDTVTAGLRVIEPIDDSSEVIYFYIKTPFGITEREFVQRRDYMFNYPEENTIIMSFQSILHPSMPVSKNRIRGETHLAGYLIKPSTTRPNSTDICILSQVDIKGSVPKAIVNMVAAKAPADWVNKLKKACEKARKGLLH